MTFGQLERRWPKVPGHLRAAVFDGLPEREQAECWADLADYCDGWIDAELELERQRAEAWCRVCRQVGHEAPCPKPRRLAVPPWWSRGVGCSVEDEFVDWLRSIPAEQYLEALTGEPVGRSRKIRCPLHGAGQERIPSLHVYPNGRGWYCHACGQGGDLFTLASLLSGIPARGPDFRILVDALLEVFRP